MSVKEVIDFQDLSKGAPFPQLKVYNSLTRSKVAFFPLERNAIKFYICGPTVYDASHLGHARAYISFDIIYRVLKNYFNFDVTLAMNITDIDDKIIKRARQNHLIRKYAEKNSQAPLSSFLKDLDSAQEHFLTRVVQNDDDDSSEKAELRKRQLQTLDEVRQTLKEGDSSFDLESVICEKCFDVLSEWLDHLYGDSVTDKSVFLALPKKWEDEFHKDMRTLNILPPDVLVRVTEYIPEIITYIEKIIANGFAYYSNGSVYFDTLAFNADENHTYAKLVPEAFADFASLEVEHGGIKANTTAQLNKKNACDFALWKNSKAGEPSWDSPWGQGRPGWHIECSVMSSIIFPGRIDIHAGGVDLKFPHHDNEVAQAEAYYGSDEWVRYFLHSGHLTISGCKMSKSLKNFITIKQALKFHSARQIRLLFLLHSWSEGLDFSENTFSSALHYEKLLKEFFLSIKDILHNSAKNDESVHFVKWNEKDFALNAKINEVCANVHSALCDSFNTKKALLAISDLISSCNTYIHKDHPDLPLLIKASSYVTKIFVIFGVISEKFSIGFKVCENGEVFDAEAQIMPYLSLLARFRDQVRIDAIEKKNSTIINTCDRLRDDDLVMLGVRLEDKPNGQKSVIKLDDRETLLRERDQKFLMAKEKKLNKLKKAEELKENVSLVEMEPPESMFKSQPNKYSKFDSDGLPTHNADGSEISKSHFKKCKKLQEIQQKRYLAFQNQH